MHMLVATLSGGDVMYMGMYQLFLLPSWRSRDDVFEADSSIFYALIVSKVRFVSIMKKIKPWPNGQTLFGKHLKFCLLSTIFVSVWPRVRQRAISALSELWFADCCCCCSFWSSSGWPASLRHRESWRLLFSFSASVCHKHSPKQNSVWSQKPQEAYLFIVYIYKLLSM